MALLEGLISEGMLNRSDFLSGLGVTLCTSHRALIDRQSSGVVGVGCRQVRQESQNQIAELGYVVQVV